MCVYQTFFFLHVYQSLFKVLPIQSEVMDLSVQKTNMRKIGSKMIHGQIELQSLSRGNKSSQKSFHGGGNV